MHMNTQISARAGGEGRPSHREPSIQVSALDSLRDLLNHEAAVFETLVRDYFIDAARLVERLRAGAAAGVRRELEDAAHALRGASSHFGARRLTDLCRRLELSARSGDVVDAERAAKEIGDEFERVRRALELELAQEVES